MDASSGTDGNSRFVVDGGGSHAFLQIKLVKCLVPDVPGRTLICLAIVKKACSTFVAFLADVSKNGIPRLSANSWSQDVRYFHIMRHKSGANLRHSILNHLLIRYITLVTNEKLVDTFSGVTINLLQPLLNVIEGI